MKNGNLMDILLEEVTKNIKNEKIREILLKLINDSSFFEVDCSKKKWKRGRRPVDLTSVSIPNGYKEIKKDGIKGYYINYNGEI